MFGWNPSGARSPKELEAAALMRMLGELSADPAKEILENASLIEKRLNFGLEVIDWVKSVATLGPHLLPSKSLPAKVEKLLNFYFALPVVEKTSENIQALIFDNINKMRLNEYSQVLCNLTNAEKKQLKAIIAYYLMMLACDQIFAVFGGLKAAFHAHEFVSTAKVGTSSELALMAAYYLLQRYGNDPALYPFRMIICTKQHGNPFNENVFLKIGGDSLQVYINPSLEVCYTGNDWEKVCRDLHEDLLDSDINDYVLQINSPEHFAHLSQIAKITPFSCTLTAQEIAYYVDNIYSQLVPDAQQVHSINDNRELPAHDRVFAEDPIKIRLVPLSKEDTLRYFGVASRVGEAKVDDVQASQLRMGQTVKRLSF
jgi:hypothetical protein